jgi:hypothetical protein
MENISVLLLSSYVSPKYAQLFKSCAKQEATRVKFSQIYNQMRTEVIMVETEDREDGTGYILPFSLLLKLLSFVNEINMLAILILVINQIVKFNKIPD